MLTNTEGVCIGEGKSTDTAGEGKVTAEALEELTDALADFHALKEVLSTLEGLVRQLLCQLTRQVQSTSTRPTSSSTPSSIPLNSRLSSMNIG